MTGDFDVRPVTWDDGVLLLDQRLLPGREEWIRCSEVESVAAAIRNLTVRGAPAIGVTAAYGMALAAHDAVAADPGDLAGARRHVEAAGELLSASRPTAVNLAWAVDRQLEVARGDHPGPAELRDALLEAARRIHDDEVEACRSIGRLGASLVPDPARILTHCNAGALATAGYGSALGVVRAAVEAGKQVHVWVDETRPVLQGARLTAWELTRAHIPNTLIPDVAAAAVMARGLVDVVVVGADRIAANGDVANKIGTYGVALAAAAHGIPFYVAAPVSTIDLDCADGAGIPIEERDADEIRMVAGVPVAAPDQPASNWAFDVTPHDLVSGIVTERGVARRDYSESLREHVRSAEMS